MSRRAGIRDVARAAGVSVALASQALNNRPGVSVAARQRVWDAAETLGYQANRAARALRLGRSDSYALIVRNLQNPFFLDVISGLQEAAAVHGSSIMVMDADYSARREIDYIEQLAARQVGGLAIAPVGPGESVARWRELCPDKPIIVLNAVCADQPGVGRVSPDNTAAVRLAMEHLLALGHRDIAFFTAPAGLMADHDRLNTYMECCAEMGLRRFPVETALAAEAIHRVTLELLRAEAAPTAIITNSDFTVHAVYAAAREAGVRIGQDLSVVGHDDLPTSALLDPPLTTLSLDRRSLGRAVFARLWGEEPLGDHVEPVALRVRSSSGPRGLFLRGALSSMTKGRGLDAVLA